MLNFYVTEFFLCHSTFSETFQRKGGSKPKSGKNYSCFCDAEKKENLHMFCGFQDLWIPTKFEI